VVRNARRLSGAMAMVAAALAAPSAAAATLMCLDSGQTDWRPGADSSAWYATLSSPVTPGAAPQWWEVHAEVEKTGE
jgi:hypothetical protein